MDHLYFPAEWEHQRCIQLTWPHAGTDWADCLTDITKTFVELSSVITRHEPLLVVTPDPASTHSTLASRLSPEALRRVTFFQCATNDTWARDHGALTLLPVAGSTASPRLLDFRFNGWGEKFPSALATSCLKAAPWKATVQARFSRRACACWRLTATTLTAKVWNAS